MKILQLLIAVALIFSAQAQDRAIEFRDITFKEALSVAKQENKPIFMDCYTVWCGPCKWMSANIFTNNTVADYYNENFVCVKFDMEKGEGKSIAKEFKINAFPTLIFVDADRQLVMKTIGASQKIEPYIELGNNALSTEYNLIALNKNVDEHRGDSDYMAKYFTIMAGADMVDETEVEQYFTGLPKSEWTNEVNVSIMFQVIEDMNSPVFKDVLARTTVYREVNPMVDDYIGFVIENTLFTALYSRDKGAEEKYLALYAKVDSIDFKNKKAVLFAVESSRLKEKDAEEYMLYCMEHVRDVCWDDANQLNEIAWYFFENTTNAKKLSLAEEWAARAVDLSPEHHILDTYGNLLYANKKYQMALKFESKAMQKAQAEGAETADYEAVIARINSALENSAGE